MRGIAAERGKRTRQAYRGAALRRGKGREEKQKGLTGACCLTQAGSDRLERVASQEPRHPSGLTRRASGANLTRAHLFGTVFEY
jgi:hypothetical protein